MNSEVAINILVKALIALGAGVAAKYGISDASQQQIAVAVAGGLVATASGIYGVWSHWGMKKVPQDATVVPPSVSQAAARPRTP